MKTKGLWMALMALMMCFVCNEAYAYDFAVENADGVTIYYNYINGGRELEVTYKERYEEDYSGSVVIPEEVTFMNRTRKVTSIGNSAFCNCRGLTSVTIPSSVTSIGGGAFAVCSGLTSVTIPNSVTSIGGGAFAGCSGLTSVTIHSSVTSIGGGAFSGCTGLTSIFVESSNSVYDSRGNCNAIIETATNTLIAGCKISFIPPSVTSIGNSAFNGCSGLTSITIPSSVTTIGNSAFSYCRGLTSITIPSSVTSIGNSAFRGCSGLTSVTIPEGVTSIASYVFRDCTGLTSVTIPSSVTAIGNETFYGCTNLTSVVIPSSVTSIGEFAFYGCSSLTSVTIPEGVTSIWPKTFYDCTSLTSVTIPSSVTSIGQSAFAGCTGLTSIDIPDCVTQISDGAFACCTGLTQVTIPEGVTSIEDGLFYGCIGLASVTILSTNVRYFGIDAFWGCDNLVSMTTCMMNPIRITNSNVFPTNLKVNGTLYVPTGSRQSYINNGWKQYFAKIVEMDDGEAIWLSIKDAEQGQTELRCTVGESYTFRFKPSAGWHVHSVVFRGADVTSWVTEDGEFTTPAMSASTEIVVTYEQGSDEVKALIHEEDEARVLVVDGEIVVKNAPAGTPICVYDLSGKMIANTIATEGATRVAVPMDEKVVVVKVGERSVKVRR